MRQQRNCHCTVQAHLKPAEQAGASWVGNIWKLVLDLPQSCPNYCFSFWRSTWNKVKHHVFLFAKQAFRDMRDKLKGWWRILYVNALLSWKIWKCFQTTESDVVNYQKRYLAISWNTISSCMFGANSFSYSVPYWFPLNQPNSHFGCFCVRVGISLRQVVIDMLFLAASSSAHVIPCASHRAGAPARRGIQGRHPCRPVSSWKRHLERNQHMNMAKCQAHLSNFGDSIVRVSYWDT